MDAGRGLRRTVKNEVPKWINPGAHRFPIHIAIVECQTMDAVAALRRPANNVMPEAG